MKRIFILLTLMALTGTSLLGAKPVVWVYSDMSDPRDQRSGGHPQNDPDDICSMASLLLSANRFDIRGIVVASTNRKNLKDPMAFVSEVFVSAYAADLKGLNESVGGFPESIPFMRSTITQTGVPESFDFENDYRDLSAYKTVAPLIQLAETQEVFVLCWGPLTEPAIAIAHCLQTGNHKALSNLVFIGHWTMSTIAQGSPEKPFHVANCRDDGRACDFIHEMARDLPEVQYLELGSIGQTGIVNGSSNYPYFERFEHSRLGQVFVKSKFYHGKPDQSDASTFWLLSEDFGLDLDSVRWDGTLPTEKEESYRDVFLSEGYAILDDLKCRAEAAAAHSQPFSDSFLASYFTYVYQYLNGKYYAYLPFPGKLSWLNAEGKTVRVDELPEGENSLDVSQMELGVYTIHVSCGGREMEFQLEVK